MALRKLVMIESAPGDGHHAEDELFQLERVCDRRVVDGRVQFYVEWTGFPGENTWEFLDDLLDENLLQRVEVERPEQPEAPDTIGGWRYLNQRNRVLELPAASTSQRETRESETSQKETTLLGDLETEDTKSLSITELQRLVLLEQLKFGRSQNNPQGTSHIDFIDYH